MYGTLRRGYTNRYARLLDRSAQHLGTARIQGRLYDLGRYPGVRLQGEADEWVTGDLFRLRNREAVLAALDAYEGLAFERVPAMAVLPAGDRVRCWVYEYKLGVAEDRRILSGDYSTKP